MSKSFRKLQKEEELEEELINKMERINEDPEAALDAAIKILNKYKRPD
jgi:hypothetical protein